MENYNRILRACPDGTIAHLDARAMQQIVNTARIDADKSPKVAQAAKILMGAARECLANGYLGAAADLYRAAMERIADHARYTYSHACRDLHYACARALDRIHRRVYGCDPVPSQLNVVKSFYIVVNLTYCENVLHYDNYLLYREYWQFCRRHHID